MENPRDCSLPGGMKDLGDKIRSDEQEEREHYQQLRQLKAIIEKGDLAVAIFRELCRRIDCDLLYTEEFDLVSPVLCKVTAEEWIKVLRTMPLAVTERTRIEIIAGTVQIVWQLICASRPIYLRERNEGRRIEN